MVHGGDQAVGTQPFHSLSIIWGSSFFTCVYLRWSYTYVHVCVKARSPPYFFETGSLPGTWDWLISLGWLSSQPQSFPCAHFPNAEMVHVSYHG